MSPSQLLMIHLKGFATLCNWQECCAMPVLWRSTLWGKAHEYLDYHLAFVPSICIIARQFLNQFIRHIQGIFHDSAISHSITTPIAMCINSSQLPTLKNSNYSTFLSWHGWCSIITLTIGNEYGTAQAQHRTSMHELICLWLNIFPEKGCVRHSFLWEYPALQVL